MKLNTNITLLQIQKFEKYILANQLAVDEVFVSTISKLFSREVKRVEQLMERLRKQLDEFEETYAKSTDIFENEYETGLLGDDIDFMEWSATIEMLKNAQKRLTSLQEKKE